MDSRRSAFGRRVGANKVKRSCHEDSVDSNKGIVHCPQPFSHKQQLCHHFGVALYGAILQKSGCRTVFHPTLEYCIVRKVVLHKQLPFHHFAETLYESLLRKSGCRIFLHLTLECCIVQTYFLRKQQFCHRFGEALYGPLRHSKLECHIGPSH